MIRSSIMAMPQTVNLFNLGSNPRGGAKSLGYRFESYRGDTINANRLFLSD